jgi:hypothetical protein
MRTRNAQNFYNKINEQNKWWNVEVEYTVEVSVRPQTLEVALDGAMENFGSKNVVFTPAKVRFSGAKTFEIEAASEAEVRKKFEGLNTGGDWEVNFYVDKEYISDGFEGTIEDADVKIVSIEESK